ncbi:hypothetical protein E3N88_06216 [Mikania micrantha]|uniref:Uncharacterized protein n=1 Tax=Mikania micrantha TaxID=192012 RepID=A0A5N6PQG4_9ASTR|nr:hypothetical protein E3N88_06216 [Mikania micrantha]
MIFGDSSLVFKHMISGIKIYFNAGKVNPCHQLKFLQLPGGNLEEYQTNRRMEFEGNNCLKWEDCEEQINLAQLASKEPILFYDELRVDDVLMRSRDTLASESILLLSNSKTC